MSANRPTWNPAKGLALAPSAQYSSKDLASHTKLKYRSKGPEEASSVDLREKLFSAENKFKEQPSRLTEIKDEQQIQTDKHFEEKVIENEEEEGNTSSEYEEESEDETEALLKELEKIKKEREVEKHRKEEEEKGIREAEAISENPLMFQDQPQFSVKRRWDDDVVFKNQAKKDVKNPKKRFINDTTRSDFHKKFLNRYIK